MAIDEQSRHRLHAKLEELLGEVEAATLMEHLPPVGWSDVATKRDLELTSRHLDEMESRFDLKLDALESRVIGKMNERFVEIQRNFILAVVTAMATLSVSVGGLAFAAAKLVH
jgi:hypothetical protein